MNLQRNSSILSLQFGSKMLYILWEFILDITGEVEYVRSIFSYIHYSLVLRVCMSHNMLMGTVSFAIQESEYDHIQQKLSSALSTLHPTSFKTELYLNVAIDKGNWFILSLTIIGTIASSAISHDYIGQSSITWPRMISNYFWQGVWKSPVLIWSIIAILVIMQ